MENQDHRRNSSSAYGMGEKKHEGPNTLCSSDFKTVYNIALAFCSCNNYAIMLFFPLYELLL